MKINSLKLFIQWTFSCLLHTSHSCALSLTSLTPLNLIIQCRDKQKAFLQITNFIFWHPQLSKRGFLRHELRQALVTSVFISLQTGGMISNVLYTFSAPHENKISQKSCTVILEAKNYGKSHKKIAFMSKL